MKKLLSLALVCALVLGLGSTAFAAEPKTIVYWSMWSAS